MRGKYSQKFLDHTKQSATVALNTTAKRITRNPAEATADLIGNKITNRITKVLINSQQNNSESFRDENDKEIPKDIYIYIKISKIFVRKNVFLIFIYIYI